MGLYNVLLLVGQGGIFKSTYEISVNIYYVQYILNKTLLEDSCIEGFGGETQGIENIWET